MTGLEPERWGEYFLATAGIGSALAGLVFVAFSINLRAILVESGVVGRGAEALVLLLGPAFVAIAGLWPSDSVARTGITIALVGLALWLEVTIVEVNALRHPMPVHRSQFALRVALAQLGTLPVLMAGATLAAGVTPGLDALPIAAVFALTGGLVGAWVLLVEILR